MTAFIPLCQCPCGGSDGGFGAILLLVLAGGMWLTFTVARWSKEQGDSRMKTTGKVLVIVALVVAVGVVFLAKKGSSSSQTLPTAPAPSVAPVAQTQRAESLPRLVDLGAGKCIPCKMMAPILEELKKECTGTFEVEFIDVWENPDAGKLYDIRLIPTQIFFDASGKERFRHEGFLSKEDILKKWKELGVEVSAQSGN